MAGFSSPANLEEEREENQKKEGKKERKEEDRAWVRYWIHFFIWIAYCRLVNPPKEQGAKGIEGKRKRKGRF